MNDATPSWADDRSCLDITSRRVMSRSTWERHEHGLRRSRVKRPDLHYVRTRRGIPGSCKASTADLQRPRSSSPSSTFWNVPTTCTAESWNTSNSTASPQSESSPSIQLFRLTATKCAAVRRFGGRCRVQNSQVGPGLGWDRVRLVGLACVRLPTYWMMYLRSLSLCKAGMQEGLLSHSAYQVGCWLTLA